MTRHIVDRGHDTRAGQRTRHFLEQAHRKTLHPATQMIRRKPRGLSETLRMTRFLAIARRRDGDA
ncbi:hypothetical protein AAD018_001580 [Aestuariibius insulae]|uniref:hypothetical protein n=1 Tax=Aestuariibius insulae TaxID=2058287 RepID=UPI00345E9E7E